MKLSKLLFSLIFLLTLSINSSFAGGTLSVCKGQPTNLVWSSTNSATVCSGNVVSGDSFACGYQVSTGGSLSIASPQANCVVDYQCSNTAGSSNYDTATLSVDNNFYWDPNATNQTTGVPDGACVAATWTDYCPSMTDPNISLSTVRDKVWQQTYNPSSDWRPKSPSAACCSETGAMGACPTGNITVTPCEIAANSNTCTATISWTSTGATDPRLFT